MSVHLPTIWLMLLAGFALLAVQLWVAQRGALRHAELLALALCALCFLGGLAALAADLWVPNWLPYWLCALVGNGLLVLGVVQFAQAVSLYLQDRRLGKWHKWGGAGALVAVGASWPLGHAAQTAVASLLLAALATPALVQTLRDGLRAETSFRVVALMLMVAIAGLLMRGAHALLYPDEHSGVLQGSPGVALASLVSFGALLAACFGLVLASFERLARRMEQLASHDSLTGCLNHQTTEGLLEHVLQRGLRDDAPVAFALLDLDHFKHINDRHGHQVGDEVLRAFAMEVRRRLRASDALGRLGGEEFGVILPATDALGALRLVEQLRASIEGLTLRGDGGVSFSITVSAGVAVSMPPMAHDAQQMRQLADKALYQAKILGRNRVQVADEWMLESTMAAVLDEATAPGAMYR